MRNALLTGLVVGVVAGLIFFVYSRSCESAAADQAQKIAELGQQLNRLEKQNAELTTELAKVQAEETGLAAQNDELKKAIASVKATGKLPKSLAYPPK
jgi:uncharacterized membrane-anchored protein YhcB (DUF1043 family)